MKTRPRLQRTVVAGLLASSSILTYPGCGPSPSDAPSVSSSASPASPAISASGDPVPTPQSVRTSLGPESNARVQLTTRCPDCPSFVVVVDRLGAIAFTGERRVRVAHAATQLTDAQTKAIFDHVVADVFVERGASDAGTKKQVELRFEDGAGASSLPGDSRCAPPSGRYDRHAAPSPRCELENALRDAVRPFVYCGPGGCPDKPDATAKAADFGDVTLSCKPACTRVLVDGKAVSKLPATLRLAAGTHEVEFERRFRPAQKTSMSVELAQHTHVVIGKTKPALELELERAMGEAAARMLGQR